MLVLIPFMMIPITICSRINIFEESKKAPSEIFRQYIDYHIIVHYDNTTFYEIDQFLSGRDNLATFLMFNYDIWDEAMKRPIGYKYFHLVYLTDPFEFEDFSSGKHNLEFVDVVVFVLKDYVANPVVQTNYQLKKIWKQKGVDSSGSVMLYDISKEEFYYVKYYFGNFSGMVNKITVQEKGELPDLPSYMNEFKDFNGHVFYVAYYPYAPFIWCESDIVDGPGCNVKGIEGNMLLLLSKYLNFTFIMKHAKTQTAGSIWRDMIEDVHYGLRDWAVGGMSTSSERLRLADFTTMLHMESYTTFYVSPELEFNTWNSVLKPFKFNIWLQLLIDIICIGVIIKCMSIIHNFSKYRRLMDFVSIPFYAIVEQSVLSNLRMRVLNLKLILSIWFLMSIIITTAYKSKLASTMIKPSRREPSSILDLYDEGYLFQVNTEDWTVLEENLANAADVRYINILDRCRNDLLFCDALEKAIKNRVAIIDEDTGLKFIILNSCHNYTGREMSRFRLVKEELFPSMHAWPLRFGVPYRYRFSTTFQILVDSGIIEYWYKSMTTKNIPKSGTYYGDLTKAGVLTISSCYGPILILLIGEMMAILAFIGEILHFRYFRGFR